VCRYEELQKSAKEVEFSVEDERMPASMCYTSGTTGASWCRLCAVVVMVVVVVVVVVCVCV
jgi:acyl-coenzyme A synthetase/AMP-(fatty) acid ligase